MAATFAVVYFVVLPDILVMRFEPYSNSAIIMPLILMITFQIFFFAS